MVKFVQLLNRYKSFLIIILPIIFIGLVKIFGPFKVDVELLYSGLGVGLGGQLIGGMPSIDPNIAQTTLTLGYRAVQELLSGNLPLWNHYEGLGQPLLGEMVSASLFPFTWLLALPNGQILMQLSLQLLGGLGTYLFLRKFGLNRKSAVLGGILFEFNGVFSWLQNACFNPIAFLPWMLYSVEGIYKSIKLNKLEGYKYISIGALMGALSIYSGFPEIVYLYGIFIFYWVVFRLCNLKFAEIKSYTFQLALLILMGLALAAPMLVSFLDFLQVAYAGAHEGDGYSKIYNIRVGMFQYFFPYAFGPIFGGPNETSYSIWGSIGGYIGFLPAYFAIASLFGGENKKTKILLIIWIVLAIGVSHGLPYFTYLFFQIPLAKLAAVSRYINITWIFAIIFLCSIFVHECDNKTKDDLRKQLTGALTIVLILSLTYFAFVRHTDIFNLFNSQLVIFWFLYSILFVLLLILLIGWVIRIESKKMLTGSLILLCIFESIFLYSIPILAYPQKGNVDLELIKFLKKDIEFQRIVNIPGEGQVISPNFGSFYGISQLNYDDPLSPKIVSNYVHNVLDPFSHPSLFLPDFPAGIDIQKRRQEFFNRIEAYGKAGVKYIVGSVNNLNRAAPLKFNSSLPLTGFNIAAGETISFSYNLKNSDLEFQEGRKIVSMSFLQGNYNNTANGVVSIELCSGKKCSFGTADISRSVDNQKFEIKLNTPLEIENSQIEITLKRIDGNNSFALWLGTVDKEEYAFKILRHSANLPIYLIPEVEFGIESAFPVPVAYRGSRAVVFEIKNYRKYFSAEGCILTSFSRNHVETNCSSPSQLIRLETFMPGWRAVINGKATSVNLVGDVFQEVVLPAGKSQVEFQFVPKYFYLGLLVFAFAIFSLIGGFYWANSRMRRNS